MAEEPIFEVVSPEGRRDAASVTAATPVADLNGAIVAELWDYGFKGDQMFTVVEQEMRARYPGIRFVAWDVFGDTHKHGDEVLARLPELLREHQATAVLSGVGA
jgi:hypothetical protein